MTREEAKRRAELYSALAEGKIIQFKQENGEWTDLKTDLMCGIAGSFRYRIKPELKYRPFKTKEECWQEMHKHPDFGWVRLKINSSLYHIDMVGNNNLIVDNAYKGLKAVFQSFEFTDGTPFGVKEE